MQINISIIMSIYNSAQYLSESISSILNQSYQDFELILVDDGSSDNSLEMCMEFADKDERIVVIHKGNGGVSSARNAGIERSRGAFLRFVDADDILPQDSLLRLITPVKENENIDLVLGKFESNDTVIYFGDDISGLKSNDEFMEHFLLYMRSFYYGVVWNKLYRKDIIIKQKLKFNEKINWSEDFFFNVQYYRYCKIFYYISETVYFYCRRENSLSTISLHYSEKELLDLEILRFLAIKGFVALCSNSKETEERAYDFMLFKINENFKKVFDHKEMSLKEKYAKFLTVIRDERIIKLINEYNMRNSCLVYRIMIRAIKIEQEKFLFLLYYIKSIIKSNQRVSNNLEGQNLTPKFPL